MKNILEYFDGNELAANVWQNKYQLKDNDNNPLEKTPDDMHRRLAKEFARIEEKYHIPQSPPDWNNLSYYGRHRDPLTEDKIFELFKDFKYIIPQGSIMQMLGNPFKIGSLSNCFVIGQPHDSYAGIMHKDEQLVQLMKRRGGVGIDISTLRPRSSKVNNAAITSSGAVTFAERYSNSTREVAQDGRRGALMITMHINHPDIEQFIEMKQDTTKVTGANVSVMLTNEFMNAVEANTEFKLRYPVTLLSDYLKVPSEGTYFGEHTVAKTVNARDLWNKIVNAAHKSAEPGIMFLDNHWNYSPDSVYPRFKGITTNPCGEIFMGEYDACRLIAINVFSFVENPFTTNATFNFSKFYEYCYEQQVLADDLVDLEIEHIERIIQKIASENIDIVKNELDLWNKILATAKAGRRTGSGLTGLGDAIAAMGFFYKNDSDTSAFVEDVMRIKMAAELDATTDMAVIRGPFPEFKPDLEYNFQKNFESGNDFYEELKHTFTEQVIKMHRFGRRNVSWSTVAPTGTVSILTETTSGIEPLFSLYYTRRKKINANDKDTRVDFIDQLGDKFQEFPVFHPKIKDWLEARGMKIEEVEKLPIASLNELLQESPWFGSTADAIDAEDRVKIQAIVQKYTTHSISSTVNLPESVKPETVSQIYFQAWKHGLKGITVYRDNSRTGILVNKTEEFKVQHAPKRGKELEANLHFATANKINYVIVVGLKEGKPYEIFAFSDNTRMNRIIKGKTLKMANGVYSFIAYDKELNKKYYVENMVTEMSVEEKASTLYVSMLLRHGTPITHVIKTMRKVSSNITSFTAAVTRVLATYIANGTVSAETCSCGSKFVYENGCKICKNCGESECG